MAQRWDGYISVTIYGKKEDEDQLLSEVESLWTHYAKELDGKVAMHLVIDKRAKGDTYYPHNILRNVRTLLSFLCCFIFMFILMHKTYTYHLP